MGVTEDQISWKQNLEDNEQNGQTESQTEKSVGKTETR